MPRALSIWAPSSGQPHSEHKQRVMRSPLPLVDVVPPAVVQVNMCLITTCLGVCSHGNTDFLLNAKSRTAFSCYKENWQKAEVALAFLGFHSGAPDLGEKKAEIIMLKVSLFQGSVFTPWRREMWGVAEKPAATPDRLSWIRAGDGALQQLFANLYDLPWTLPKTIPFFSSVHGARGNPAPFLLSPGHQAVFLHLERRCLQDKCGEVKEDGQKCMSAWRLPSYIDATPSAVVES